MTFSGKYWYQYCRDWLKSVGFIECPTCLVLFSRTENDGSQLWIILYVDDFSTLGQRKSHARNLSWNLDQGSTLKQLSLVSCCQNKSGQEFQHHYWPIKICKVNCQMLFGPSWSEEIHKRIFIYSSSIICAYQELLFSRWRWIQKATRGIQHWLCLLYRLLDLPLQHKTWNGIWNQQVRQILISPLRKSFPVPSTPS